MRINPAFKKEISPSEFPLLGHFFIFISLFLCLFLCLQHRALDTPHLLALFIFHFGLTYIRRPYTRACVINMNCKVGKQRWPASSFPRFTVASYFSCRFNLAYLFFLLRLMYTYKSYHAISMNRGRGKRYISFFLLHSKPSFSLTFFLSLLFMTSFTFYAFDFHPVVREDTGTG